MNRVLKFRVWDVDEKKMIFFSISPCIMLPLWQKEDVVMQYIEWDYGRKIGFYEGDIIKKDEEIAIVTFEDQEFVAFSKENGGHCWNLLIGEFEVIGNIYQNEDLLK